VNASEHFLAGKSRNYTLYLPPVTEAHDILIVAAFFGARSGFETGIIAETLDKFCGIGESRPAGNEGRVHVP
jgi:hypothetical protein